MIDPRSELARLLGLRIVRAEPADGRASGGGERGQRYGAGTRAWRIATADGQRFFAKRAEPAELAWSVALAAETAVVPQVVVAQAGWLVAEWIDGLTLDDSLQAEHDAPRLAAALLAGVRELEAACARVRRLGQADSVRPRLGSDKPARANPPADPTPPALTAPAEAIAESIGESLNQAEAGLAWAARHFGVALPGDFGARLEALAARLARSPASIGPLDVNARNALLEGRRVRIVDFSLIGCDLPERRVLLYGTALGAGRRDGRFVTLGPALVESVSPEGAERLDVCDLLQWGVVALRLAAALIAPESRPGQFVRAVWGEPARRLAQLRGLLARPLSPLTAPLRAPFGP